MPTCPNCSYELVLLSSRPKYKCALCSRLYPQREVETKAFREWNKRQRENDLHNINLEGIQKRERKNLLNRKWNLKNPAKAKAMREKYLENHRENVYDYL